MLKKYILSFLLFTAGLIHLIAPQVFLSAIPSQIPFPVEIIYLTGLFEIFLALGLLLRKTQNVSAQAAALYFIILIPIHVYVAANGIEIFGISNKILLWLRTLFQLVFIFWALSLQTSGWIIAQSWKNVFFIHYKIDPKLIAHMVPFKLDLFEGHAVISVVPFLMDGIRFPFLPQIPKVSRLWELNIRTYVEVNGKKGVYFFTLETDSKMGELIAKNFFALPYRFSKIKALVSGNHYKFEHSRADLSFKLEATISDAEQVSTFDLWATERYSLFTQKRGVTYQGVVLHEPWQLQQVKIEIINDQFTKMVLPGLTEFSSASFSRSINVKFRPFKAISYLQPVMS